MRKYMPAIVLLVLIFSFITVVSAADVDNTQELTDNAVSQEQNIENFASSTDNQVIDDESNTKETESDNEEGDDCCSTIIQGNNNDSVISFRRDSAAGVTLNISKNATFLKQQKTSGNYFFHVLISNNGWIIGNGGTDSEDTIHTVEKNSIIMVNQNMISSTYMNAIIKAKSSSAKSHYVIKAPNGTYSLFINYYGKTFTKSGTLSPREYLVVPNNPIYFKTGKYPDIVKSNNISYVSKLLTAQDKYGVERRNIMTYYYRRVGQTSSVKIYACNDDGKYVNKNTTKYVDGIRFNGNYIPASSVPNVDSSITVGLANFTIGKVETILTAKSFTTNSNTVTLSSTVKDENGNKVNVGFVSILVDNKTLKYANGTTVYIDVKNGVVSYKYTLPEIWKKTNYTYYMRYYGKSNYLSSLGSVGTIKLDMAKINVTHAAKPTYGTNLTITTKVTYKANNSNVNSGQVLFKVNGKTIRNNDSSTYLLKVEDGVATYNLILDEKYSPKPYNITVVYVNGRNRLESNTNISIQKIPVHLTEQKITVTNKTVRVQAKFVDDKNKPVLYNSYMSAKINGKTIKNENGSTRIFNFTNGVIDFTFDLTAKYRKGEHTFTFVIPELRAHLSVRQDAKMTIA